MLLRVPGLGTRAVKRIVTTRRHRTLRLDDVAKLCQSIDKVRPFITTLDYSPGRLTDRDGLRESFMPKAKREARQLELF